MDDVALVFPVDLVHEQLCGYFCCLAGVICIEWSVPDGSKILLLRRSHIGLRLPITMARYLLRALTPLCLRPSSTSPLSTSLLPAVNHGQRTNEAVHTTSLPLYASHVAVFQLVQLQALLRPPDEGDVPRHSGVSRQ